MTNPTVAALPPAPSRGDAPDAFESLMDAFLAALAGFVTDVNASATWMNAAFQLVPMAEESLALVSSYTARHQGAHATEPTQRNGGAALQAGDMYFNTATGLSYAWSGSAWAVFVPAGRFRKTVLGEAQVAAYTGTAGESVTLTKTSAALTVNFPAVAGSVAGDLFRVVNQTARKNHLINGNGAQVSGASGDVEFDFTGQGMTFEFDGVNNWSPLNG